MKPWEQAKKEQDEAAAKPALPPWEQARADKGQDQYNGTVLPFSKGPDGTVRFDSDAGVLGALKRAFTLPREAYDGKIDLDRGAKHILEPDPTIERVTEAAGAFLPTNPAVRAGDHSIPGLSRRPGVPGKVKPPTSDELFDTAGRQYDAVRDSGVDYKSTSIADLAKGLKTGLERDGILDVPEGAPSTHQILDKLTNPPDGSVAPIQNVEAARRAFQGIAETSKNGTERGAAQRAVRQLSAFIERGDPQSVVAGPAAEAGKIQRSARQNYAAGKRSDELYGIERNAERRSDAANSGSNEGNAIRSRLATLLKQKEPRPGKPMRGYTAEETAAVEAVNQGSRPANATRRMGNVLGGGGGLGQLAAMSAAGAPGMLAGDMGAASLGAVGAYVTGTALKGGSNALTRRALRNVDKMTRQRSPLYAERQSQAPMSHRPMHTQQAILRAMLLAEQGDK